MMNLNKSDVCVRQGNLALKHYIIIARYAACMKNIYLDTFQCSSGMFSADAEESPFLKYKLPRGLATKEKCIETLKELHAELFAHRGTTTDNTNELTTGQIQVLLNFSKRPKEQGIRDGSIGAKSSQKRFLTIWKPLPKNALKAAYKYEEGKWMQPGTIKRVYLPELKKYQLDVGQTIVSIAKGADRPAYSR
ncbi:hypothetical protein CU097_002453, partial [Rhizopus azygosporus]